MAQKVLIVDDEPELVAAFGRILQGESYETEAASSGSEALELIERGGIDLVLLDVGMPNMTGIEVLSRLRDRSIQIPVVMMSGAGSVDLAVQAIRLGALDFAQKPILSERLLLTVRNALRFSHLQEAHERLQADLVAGSELVGEGAVMQQLRNLIAKVAPSDGRILIMGEHGTGKELVAAAIHAGSPRKRAPFVKLNCGSVAKDLVESELFGHEKGAFTGAISARKGRFELANGGTLLLDEIGDMPMPMQVKLLRVLQEGLLERVGGTRSIAVDVRVLAATNRDLSAMVEDGSFREDLYYRLNVLTLRVPPLRDRREDIPLLVRHFTRPGAKGHGLVLDESAIVALGNYSYPGNVRELQNIIERMSILHAGETIDDERVRSMLSNGRLKSHAARASLYQYGASLRDLMKEAERRIIEEALAANANNKVAAAAALNTERSHFYKKCRQFGLAEGDN